jgi:hypothetical protein
MTKIKKLDFVRSSGTLGALALVSAGLISLGCSSSGSSSGGGGSTGTGNGGSNASGGSTGTGGTGGAGPGCSISDPPASAVIADFSGGDGGIEIMGGISTYGSNPNDHPSYSKANGVLTITDQALVGAMPQYVGLVIYFNGNAAGTQCIDAHTYTGVQFDISGTLMGPGCSIQYSTNDSEHTDDTTGTPVDPKASGPAGSYSPQLTISTITSAPTTTKVPFAEMDLKPGSPDMPIDPTKLEGVQWQMTVPPASDGGPTECDLSLTIDNVTFY